MKTVRTTLDVPEVVLQHIRKNLPADDTFKSFVNRAIINQLEREFSDFEVRDALEEESDE